MDGSNNGDSASSTTTTSSSLSNTRDQYLKHLNKLSQKISKPPPSAASRPPLDPSSGGLDHSHNHQQPPVYNINKSDFRQVVQKLTGSPAHERLASPPPIQPPKPPSSRLHRIRPPPLAQLNRPPPVLDCAGPQNQNPNLNNQFQISATAANPCANNQICRPGAPLSPLPPLPSVHAAAESPVSAYMRYLQSSSTNNESKPYQFAGFSPLAPAAPIPPPPASVPPPPQFQFPLSPIPFGRLNSPKSSNPPFSPTSGFPQIPLSPVPSPKGGGF